MKAQFLPAVIFALLAGAVDASAVSCKDNWQQLNFPELDSAVTVVACVQNGFVGDMQRVDWAITNTTGDRLQVTFTKVYHFSCGKSLSRNADVIVRPWSTAGGSAFSGDLDLGDAPEVKSLCGKDGYISRVFASGFRVRNISLEERAAELKRKEEESRRQESARKQREQQEAERRQREQDLQRQQQERAQQDRNARQQREYEQRKQQDEAARQRALEHLEQTRKNLDQQSEEYSRQSDEQMQRLKQDRERRYDNTIGDLDRSQGKWDRRAEQHEYNSRREQDQLRGVESEQKQAESEYDRMLREMLEEAR